MSTTYERSALTIGEREEIGRLSAMLGNRLPPIAPIPAPVPANTIGPHHYVPDWEAMGDCATCGHAQSSRIHTTTTSPRAPVQATGRGTGYAKATAEQLEIFAPFRHNTGDGGPLPISE